MKKTFLLSAMLSFCISTAFAQTTPVTVDANDVVNSNSKLVIYTGVGQSFFTGHQAGSAYSYPYGIFRAITDNPDNSNIFFDGVNNGTTKFFVRSDGNGYFAGKIGIGTDNPQGNLDIFSGSNTTTTPLFSIRSDFHTVGNYGMIRFGDYTQTSQYQKGALIYESVAGSARGKFHIALENTDGNGSVSLSDARLTVLSNGNVGVGTTSPNAQLEVQNGSNGTNIAVTNTVGGYASLAISDNSNSVASLNFTNSLNLVGGPVGVGVVNAASLFQVDDGCTKASIGSAGDSQDLNWGTSYLGFNASRSGTSWLTNGDTNNNGGGVIYSSIFGDMYFSIIPRTGGAGQTLQDHDVANNIALKISHTDGAVYAKQIYVQTGGFPDYVFKPTYQLRSLAEIKTYIEQNQHLPDMPPAEQVEKDGLNLGEMNKLLTKKVEELTLYLIEKDKQINDQKLALEKQQQQINQILQKIQN